MKTLTLVTVIAIIIVIKLITPTQAQTNPCTQQNPPRAGGLVSTPNLLPNSKFFTGGGCIINPKAAFVPLYASFADLKSLYYDQSKAAKNTLTAITAATNFTADTIYYDNGDLTISASPQGSGTAVIFVSGNLNINSNYVYGAAQSGTVLVVGGNVNIDKSVTQIDGVIIAEGTICTAFADNACPKDNILSPQLVINGSLISLNESHPVQFRRTLAMADNFTSPAEKINHQTKYLVILRDLLSDTFQKWSEIDASVQLPAAVATPAPTSQ